MGLYARWGISVAINMSPRWGSMLVGDYLSYIYIALLGLYARWEWFELHMYRPEGALCSLGII